MIEREIPAVIGMQFEITDRAAIVFASEFYSALADGLPVDSSVAEARKAIYADRNDIEWGTPVLFMRVADGRLFDVAEHASIRVAVTTPVEARVPEPEPGEEPMAHPAIETEPRTADPPRELEPTEAGLAGPEPDVLVPEPQGQVISGPATPNVPSPVPSPRRGGCCRGDIGRTCLAHPCHCSRRIGFTVGSRVWTVVVAR